LSYVNNAHSDDKVQGGEQQCAGGALSVDSGVNI
jgi:hypothetical protein